eukprot:TRINITY_DN62841_c0_g1_i1.p1 TRINITY_DN62841_c0_g1~~TRINITY_DN62841_c0_g1_i1.p1  ORF type:complete len:659 (+),score=148.15 TRINITY_DN62841_c0_g1_i1:85-2061(+)
MESQEKTLTGQSDEPCAWAEGDAEKSAGNDDGKGNARLKRCFVLFLALIVAPCACRFGNIGAPGRCLAVLVSILMLNLYEVMPLYCSSLFIPVLGTLCAVLGEERGTVATSTLLVANIFNNTSFMVLGALVINAIFTKCGLERRFMNLLLRSVCFEGWLFLLLTMLGGTLMCSVLYSGAMVLLAALVPAMRQGLEAGIMSENGSKRLLLGVAFSANAGAALLPISSPVNLITISLLHEFDSDISIDVWAAVAVPVAMATIIGSWLVLLILFPGQCDRNESWEKQKAMKQTAIPNLTRMHWLFLGLGAAAVLGITVFADRLEPLIGHPACLSLAVVVVVFGSGFLSRQEFCQLNWDLLALIGGTNVMAFLVRETGLGVLMSTELTKLEVFAWAPFWSVLLVMVLLVMVTATFVGHTITGVLLMPLIVAIGVKLQATEVTAILVAVAIPLSMGLVQSSADNSMSKDASATLGRRSAELSQQDYWRSGVLTSVIGVVLLFALGFEVATHQYGLPPPMVIAGTGTPKNLKPKVVKENVPHELREVDWNGRIADWKDFERRPGKKAFAVGNLEKGMKTRAWAASWNHESQDAADRAAISDCESIAKKCSLIWPAPKMQQMDSKNGTSAKNFLQTPRVQAHVGRALSPKRRRGGVARGFLRTTE